MVNPFGGHDLSLRIVVDESSSLRILLLLLLLDNLCVTYLMRLLLQRLSTPWRIYRSLLRRSLGHVSRLKFLNTLLLKTAVIQSVLPVLPRI